LLVPLLLAHFPNDKLMPAILESILLLIRNDVFVNDNQYFLDQVWEVCFKNIRNHKEIPA
jgi:hypothetical protein